MTPNELTVYFVAHMVVADMVVADSDFSCGRYDFFCCGRYGRTPQRQRRATETAVL